MINALLLVMGFGLLVVQSLLHHVLPTQWLLPMLVLPMVLFMAVGDFSLARGASLSFVLGYMADAFSGLPMGLYTFSFLNVFLLSRVAGLKLFLHGVVFQILLTFVASLAIGVLVLGLHVVFGRDQHQLAMAPALAVVTTQGLCTALCSPLVFSLMRRLPGAEAPKPEEA